MRIDKYLAHAGFGTRKEVKELIAKKVVFVDNILIRNANMHIEDTSIVIINGKIVTYKEFYYVLLNKPTGYISATEDNFHKIVLDLVPQYKAFNLAPVGRLDIDTTGVLLLTNNGKLAHFLISPNHHVEKEYAVHVNHDLTKNLIEEFSQGVILEDGYKCLPAKLVILDKNNAKITINEGKYHQVKRMFKMFGYEVLELERIRFDSLTTENIERGSCRELSDVEINTILKRIK